MALHSLYFADFWLRNCSLRSTHNRGAGWRPLAGGAEARNAILPTGGVCVHFVVFSQGVLLLHNCAQYKRVDGYAIIHFPLMSSW